MTRHILSLGNMTQHEISIEIPTLAQLRNLWINIPYIKYKEMICKEHQCYILHKDISRNMMYQSSSEKKPLFGDLRIGLRFPLLVMAILITEGSLLSHALKRKLITTKEANNIKYHELKNIWSSEVEYQRFSSDFAAILALRHNLHASKKTRKYTELEDALGKNFYFTLVSIDKLIEEMKKIIS